MKLETVTLKDFRRFTDLTIQNIPASARLIMLAGPNGCGKSSLFDAFAIWHRRVWRPQRNPQWDTTYHSKGGIATHGGNDPTNQIMPTFHGTTPTDVNELKKLFYVRSAYRNDPEFQIQQLNHAGPILDEERIRRLIDNDAAVSKNYSRMASNAFQEIFEYANPDETIGQFRDRVIAKVRDSFTTLFPDLTLNSLSNPLVDGTFRFTKGSSEGFEFKNLSGGEKAAFDLILDIVVRQHEYDNTVFCIDEPESHMNSRLQAKLLQVLYDLIPEHCQLVMATHSIGMMRCARDIADEHPGTVAFLDFGNRNFDKPQIIEPTAPNRNFWRRAYEVALDDLAALVAPSRVVICEGAPATRSAGQNDNHDARCYDAIFQDEFPETRFVSMGNHHEVSRDDRGLAQALWSLVDGIKVVRLIDRDDRTDAEIAELRKTGIRVLSQRNLESYLYSDEVLTALADSSGRLDKAAELLEAKQRACATSNGAPDDLKPASGLIYNACKSKLGLTQCGNDAKEFARQTLAPIVKPGMVVYEQLKQDIFGRQ